MVSKTMSQTLDDIIESSSIEELKALIKQAESAIEKKKHSEIEGIREAWIKMAERIDMTPEEILQHSGRKKRSSGKAKYWNPANPTQTWTGFGKKPNWLKDGLAAGQPLESFLIPE
jgi:DNA-binding protein H-NS